MPIKVFDLELSEEFKPLGETQGYDGLYILVRYHSQPVGWVYITDLEQPIISINQLRPAIVAQLGWPLVPVVLGEQFRAGMVHQSSTPPISVIVCHHHQAYQLERCLQALLALDYPAYEIIVVDSGSPAGDTAQLIARLPVRYVRQAQSGLSGARNRGIAEARYDIIAFTEADAYPDRQWLRAIANAFNEPEVVAVTGLVAPAELETEAQVLYEFNYKRIGHRFRRRIVKRTALTDGKLYQRKWFVEGKFSPSGWHIDRKLVWRRSLTDQELLWTNAFGSGANMAFRRDLFAAIGPFDTTLDFGASGMGGNDTEMLHRLIMQGYTLACEPAALVWCTHPQNLASLRRLVYDNGRSFGAYLLTCARNRTMSHFSILRFAARQWLWGWLLHRLFQLSGWPRSLVVLELVGAVLSPLFYWTSQIKARQVAAISRRRAFYTGLEKLSRLKP